jgi:hypothetical protein
MHPGRVPLAGDQGFEQVTTDDLAVAPHALQLVEIALGRGGGDQVQVLQQLPGDAQRRFAFGRDIDVGVGQHRLPQDPAPQSCGVQEGLQRHVLVHPAGGGPARLVEILRAGRPMAAGQVADGTAQRFEGDLVDVAVDDPGIGQPVVDDLGAVALDHPAGDLVQAW